MYLARRLERPAAHQPPCARTARRSRGADWRGPQRRPLGLTSLVTDASSEMWIAADGSGTPSESPRLPVHRSSCRDS